MIQWLFLYITIRIRIVDQWKKEKSSDTWLGMNYFININLETNETNIEMLDERIWFNLNVIRINMFLETTGNMLHFEPQKNKQKKSICIQCYSARAGHSTFPVFHDTDDSVVVGVLDEHPVTAHTVRWVVSESLLHRHAGVLSAIRTEQQPAQVKRQCRRIYESLASLQCLRCLSWECLRRFFSVSEH